MSNLTFTYQQPVRIWSKSGCAENLWIIINTEDKTIKRFTSCGYSMKKDIEIKKSDCNKIYRHFINEGYTDITEKY